VNLWQFNKILLIRAWQAAGADNSPVTCLGSTVGEGGGLLSPKAYATPNNKAAVAFK
jgi:hypothetical protein